MRLVNKVIITSSELTINKKNVDSHYFELINKRLSKKNLDLIKSELKRRSCSIEISAHLAKDKIRCTEQLLELSKLFNSRIIKIKIINGDVIYRYKRPLNTMIWPCICLFIALSYLTAWKLERDKLQKELQLKSDLQILSQRLLNEETALKEQYKNAEEQLSKITQYPIIIEQLSITAPNQIYVKAFNSEGDYIEFTTTF